MGGLRASPAGAAAAADSPQPPLPGAAGALAATSPPLSASPSLSHITAGGGGSGPAAAAEGDGAAMAVDLTLSPGRRPVVKKARHSADAKCEGGSTFSRLFTPVARAPAADAGAEASPALGPCSMPVDDLVAAAGASAGTAGDAAEEDATPMTPTPEPISQVDLLPPRSTPLGILHERAPQRTKPAYVGALALTSPRTPRRALHPRAHQLADDFAALPTDELQEHALQAILERCTGPQLQFLANALMPYLQRDFISKLPSEVSLRILSYLDAKSLARACRVSQAWRRLATDEFLWKRLCLQHGYFFDFAAGRPLAPQCVPPAVVFVAGLRAPALRGARRR